MEFREGCCEVDYILEHLAPEDKKKIPDSVCKFFKENKALFYKVNLDETRPLEEQELKDETKAFLKLLHYKYLANEEQKNQFIKNMKDTNRTSAIEEDYVFDTSTENIEVNQLTIYKENKFLSFLKRILNFFK